MNVITRGAKNTLRSPLRSGAIVLMFAISIALIVSMLVARSSVNTKINEVKASAGTSITIRPAGVMGPMGGGDPLTAAQLSTIQNTTNISSTVLTLTDQVSSDDTSLTASLELGSFGRRNQESTSESSSTSQQTNMPTMTPRITVTGTNDVNSVSTDGTELNISSGESIEAEGSANVALIGTKLATKNSLAVGDSFTLYGETFTVKGVYETGNTFQDGGIIVPLTALQTVTNQTDVVNSIIATVKSSDNVETVVESLKTSLGDDVDITSDIQRAEESVTSLESISALALTGVIAASAAGAAIVLLAMIMVVRERRREIGVMKAIGGQDSKVVGQFIIEGLTLTFIGAVVGILLGVMVSGPMTTSMASSGTNSSYSNSRSTERGQVGAGSEAPSGGGPGEMMRGGFEQLKTNTAQVTASLTPEVFITASLVIVAISLIGTAVPAWLTARIRPAEVLRNE